ncbi:LLM class flavin-dependent oxidoreductase [Gordonia sp. GN26]
MTLAWFVNYTPTGWNRPWSGTNPQAWLDGSFHIDMAKALERSCIDFIMLEDSSVVPENFGGDMVAEFKATVKAPKHDPIPLAAAIAQETEHLGIVTTMSTSLYPPDRLARIQSTLDELSGGRCGWNIVTSFEDLAAQNVGLEKLWEHDDRYKRSDEYLRAVSAMWESGDRVEHRGEHYVIDGPAARLSHQDRPLLCQAGGSSAGMDFAATWADVIVSVPVGLEAMKAYRDGIRERIERSGGDPDRCRVLFMVVPILGETDAEARAKRDRFYSPDSDHFLRRMVQLSNISEIDFSQYDFDSPVPEDATTNGAQSILDSIKRQTRGSSLRKVLGSTGDSTSLALVGTPAIVADQMEEAMEVVGGDGFLFHRGGAGLITRHYLAEVLDGLLPELQRRGLARSAYAPGTLRERTVPATVG